MRKTFKAVAGFVIPILAVSPAHCLDIDGWDRTTPAEYAAKNGLSLKSVEADFAASGQIHCDNSHHKGSASAELIAKDVIVTAAHLLWEPEAGDHQCEVKAAPNECRFETVVDGKVKSVPVMSVLAVGGHCPDHIPDDSNDWLILKLKRPVKGVAPYAIGDSNTVRKGDKVLAVNGANGDLARVNGRLPMTISECEWRDEVNGLRATTCGSSYGTSGSAILSPNREILAIVQGDSEDEELFGERIKDLNHIEKYSCGRYDQLTCATWYVPVFWKFKEELKKYAAPSTP